MYTWYWCTMEKYGCSNISWKDQYNNTVSNNDSPTWVYSHFQVLLSAVAPVTDLSYLQDLCWAPMSHRNSVDLLLLSPFLSQKYFLNHRIKSAVWKLKWTLLSGIYKTNITGFLVKLVGHVDIHAHINLCWLVH